MYLYLIVNKTNGKYYVGKTSRKNLSSYLNEQFTAAAKGSQCKPRLYNAIRKYGNDAFAIHPLMSTLTADEELFRWEIELISLMRAQDRNIGYNVADGGQGVTITPELLAKRSVAAKTRWADPCFRSKAMTAMRGRKLTDEHKALLSAAKQGKTTARKGGQLSDSHVAALKAAWVRRKQKVNHASTR